MSQEVNRATDKRSTGTGTAGTDDGNTNSSSVKNYKGRAYFITWNNYDDLELEQLEQWFEANAEEYHSQKETGESGTPHIQGVFRFKNPRSFKAVLTEMHGISKKIHLEICRNFKKAMDYCDKEETRTGKGPSNKLPDIPDPLEGKVLKDWQKVILQILDMPPVDREIYWFTDIKGGGGKTTLAKSICIKNPNAIYVSGKVADVKCGITKMIQEKKKYPNPIMFDFVRSNENFISYEAIESVKNGIFFNTKYESGQVQFPTPHVIIFANFNPDLSKLSADRWVITDINK